MVSGCRAGRSQQFSCTAWTGTDRSSQEDAKAWKKNGWTISAAKKHLAISMFRPD
jgi:hypothetical protein